MPNYKIFQDNPDQARIKIYGNSSVALQQDPAGYLSVTAPANGLTITAPASGLSITPPSDGLSITSPANGLTVTATADGLAITPPTGGLSVTAPANGLTVTATADGLSITPPTGGLSVTSPANGLTVTATADGLSITPPTGGLSITPPTDGLLITSTGLRTISELATTEVVASRNAFTDTDGTPDTAFTVLGVKEWTFGLVNNSLATNAQAFAKLQISPDGAAWIDHAGPVTISQNAADSLVASVFLKYARVYYGAVNASSAVTLRIYFQGQS